LTSLTNLTSLYNGTGSAGPATQDEMLTYMNFMTGLKSLRLFNITKRGIEAISKNMTKLENLEFTSSAFDFQGQCLTQVPSIVNDLEPLMKLTALNRLHLRDPQAVVVHQFWQKKLNS
jgi:hypothetical protein